MQEIMLSSRNAFKKFVVKNELKNDGADTQQNAKESSPDDRESNEDQVEIVDLDIADMQKRDQGDVDGIEAKTGSSLSKPAQARHPRLAVSATDDALLADDCAD